MKPDSTEPPEGVNPSAAPIERTPSVGKTFGLVAVLTVLSKFAGLIRDMVVAWGYGTTVIADAYNFAYLFTGNVLILFGGLGGPFHSSIVTVMTPRKDDKETSGVLASQIMAITFIVLTAISIAMYFAAPYLISLLKGMYAQMQTLAVKDQFEAETLNQLRIMLPLIVISGLVGVCYGILNVYNRVVSASLSPAIASIAIIVAVYFSAAGDGQAAGWALAVGTLVGAIGQLAVQLPFIAQLHLKWRMPPLKAVEGLKEYSAMLWPAAFSTSIGQLIVYVDAFFALQHEGAWTAIVNSNRLVQLPLGILVTAMLVPMLPRFTQHVTEEKIDDLKDDLRRSLRFMWFLALPMSAILIAIPMQIVQVLFQRGEFNAESASLVTAALIFLVPSIFFYVARDLMTRVFYAYKDSETPYRVALIAIFVKALLDAAFIQMMPTNIPGAISLATTVITIFNLSLLTWALKKKTGNLGFTQLCKPIAIMLLGTILCGAATFGTYFGLDHLYSASAGWYIQLAYVALASLLGLLLYIGVCTAFKLEEPMAVAKRLPVLRKFVH